ncbi:MAG: hypothetical protein ACLS8Y_08695 [Lachnospira sp.]|jgi:transposase of ISAar33, IS21 family, istA
MQIVNRYTGKTTTVYLFVSCLSYSRYAYVEPTLDMKIDTWIRCHVNMYEAFEGYLSGQSVITLKPAL